MNEQGLRDRWERSLKNQHNVEDKELLDHIWEDMKREKVVDYALIEPDTGLQDLIDSAEEAIKYFKLGGGRRDSLSRQQEEREIVPNLEDYQIERAEAFSEYLATIAGGDRTVQRFRQDYLSGQTVTPDEAYAFLDSPAAAYLSYGFFKKRGIPVIGHRARVLDVQRSPIFANPWFVEVTLQIEWPGGTHKVSFRSSGPKQNRPGFTLVFPDRRKQKVGEVGVRRRSALDELRKLSERLAKRYRWTEEDATWFVLTGQIPWKPPLTGRVAFPSAPGFSQVVITLTVEPWVHAEMLMQFYRDLQHQILGRNNRRLTERNLSVFRFIMEKTETRTPSGRQNELELIRAPWRKLLGCWNETLPKGHVWRYKDVRNFRRDFTSTWLAVAYPEYEEFPRSGGD